MASAQQIAPENSEAGSGVPSSGKKRLYLRYLLLAALFPVLGFLSAFPLVCTRSYERWSESQWGPELEFPFAADTPNADVVIFGDSSAFLGIDPRQINAALGIHSVVLPSTVGSLPVIGDTPLRSYLAHHTQPKLIVLYFSAWNLDFAHAAKARLFEGEEMMMRHQSLGEIVRYEVHHPVEFFEFPLRLYSTVGPKMVAAILHHEDRTKTIAASLGHAPYVEKFGGLTDLCRIPGDFLKQQSEQTIEELRQRYTRPGTQVMVYLAPLPRCTNSGVMANRSFANLGAEPPRLLSPTYFAGDIYYAHIRPSFVPANTDLFTRVLKQNLEQHQPDLLHVADRAELAGAAPVAQ